ncbi:MAG: PilZ domain-containing protein [Myxococcota bacterium]
MPDERREHVRKAVELTVTFSVDGGPPETARLQDLSLGGAFLATLDELAFGTPLRLTLPLSTETIDVDAVVRWRKKGQGLGVQFGPIGAKPTFLLTEYIADMDPVPDSRLLQPGDL